MQPGEQEISDKRDDAATAERKHADPIKSAYAAGVRDALNWVLEDGADEPEV